MPALLLGSIGVVAETSDLQRKAYNDAFTEAGLDWHWSEDTYRSLLKAAGGRTRLSAEAAHKGQDIDVEAIHARKTALFGKALDKGVPPRPGVRATLEAAREAGWKTGFVTMTERANVERILAATGLDAALFDIVTDRSLDLAEKPDPAVYAYALERLGTTAGEAVAVEDNPDGLAAAHAAGIATFAFPGAYHDAGGFEGAAAMLDRLDFATLRSHYGKR